MSAHAGTANRYRRGGCRCKACTAAYQRELADNRARKETYRGTCADCGKPTSGSDGPGTARAYCQSCSARRVGERRRGTTGRTAELLEFCREPRRAREITDHMGSASYASSMAYRLIGYGLLVRLRRGVYQSVERPAAPGAPTALVSAAEPDPRPASRS